ncbi:putative glycosidase crf2 [Smittium mucronatum]|uniref:Putative glycosidase crf2 n=1 Tax=Smittium mucronatum TaxID=133383 RepID=A0A1R0H7C7_9FUNG|nr:putative glycosidase crf2 [Smittium mucronatum]
MYSKIIKLLAFLSIVSAQCVHYGDGKSNCPSDTPCCFQGYCDANAYFCMLGNCEPKNSYSPDSCWPKPMCKNTNENFSNPSSLVDARDFTGDVDKEAWYSSELVNYSKISNGNLVLALKPASDLKATGQGTTVYFSRWIDHGKITINAKSACRSPGVVSSFIVRNEFGDEIDFEWVGKDTSNVQTNYYYNNELDYTKMVPSPNLGDTTSKYIQYTIDWQLDSISWYAAGNLIRTVRRADTWSVAENVYKFPDRPAQLSFSVWDGSNGRPKGTSDWAGSPIIYTPSTEYDFNIDNVQIKCLYSGNDTYKIPTKAMPQSADSQPSGSTTQASGNAKPTPSSGSNTSSGGKNDQVSLAEFQSGQSTILSPSSASSRLQFTLFSLVSSLLTYFLIATFIV